jgi:hypothetical protein
MPIVANDIKFYLSGGAGNSDPNASLGGVISTTEITGATLHNLFDIVSSTESEAGDTEYRCFYVKNTHGSLVLQNSKIWISTDNSGADASIAISLATQGINGTAATIANEDTAPGGQSFTSPTTEGGALTIGNIPAGQHQAVWVRRTITSGAAASNNNNVTFTVKGDTAA